MKSKLDVLLLSKLFYIVLGCVFIIVSYVAFVWNHPIQIFDREYSANTNMLGAYGDFVGGVLGTIFTLISVLLVVKTFKEQQSVSNQNNVQLEVQHFNDLFFELLRLYQSEVKELCGQQRNISKAENEETIEFADIKYNDKDFFDFKKKYVQDEYSNSESYDGNRKYAVKYYMLFYIENSTKLGAYFRTLYRIYDLIDGSDINEKTKKDYLKIMRAQLTESELFFIRYNAMTFYGHKLIGYINKYNILKHLPAFELLEFKDWWSTLNQVEKMGVNIVYDSISRLIRTQFSAESRTRSRQYLSSDNNTRYKFQVKITGNYDVSLLLTINKSEENNSMEYTAFEKFDSEKIQRLLDFFIKEIFLYSNFERFNAPEEVETYSSPIRLENNITYIGSGVRNIQKKPLVLCYSKK